MGKTLKVLLVISLLFVAATSARGEDQVLTIYFCGTTIKSDAYLAENSAWHKPDLVSSFYKYADGSAEMTQTQPYPLFLGWWEPSIGEHTGPHHKYIVNGAGTSPESNIFDLVIALLGTIDPDIGLRSWNAIKYEALLALDLVRQNHPDDDIILNLVGFSRGGISTMQMAREVSAPAYSYVKKVNILAYDPVPGGFDPVGKWDTEMYLVLSSKVNQYIGLYAKHERTYQFEPVIPSKVSLGTKTLTLLLPGGHETMVGNLQIDGHNITLSAINPFPDVEDPDYHYAGDVSRVIAEQLLSSFEWGSVPISMLSGVSTKAQFGSIVSNMWAQNYSAIPLWGFGPMFGTFDLCYATMGRDHHLRMILPVFVLHGRLCFVMPYRHTPEWAWSCWIWPIWFPNVEQVYWLDNVVPQVNVNAWDVLQSFRGAAPPDTTPPVPDLAELPTIIGECSVSITNPPTATDNTAGVVTGTTTDPLDYTEQGVYIITWTYDDGNGNTETQIQTIIVQDTIPPVIESISASPGVLWPPNHKMVAVEVDVIASDNCGESPTSTIISVSSSDSDNGLGDGNTSPDWDIAGDLSADLRAERSGRRGSDRVYTITIECFDAVGNSSTGTVSVTVPHDKGKK